MDTATAAASPFWVLRYRDDVDIDLRKHAATLGRFGSWLDADEERDRRPAAALLEVQGPRTERVR